jgi:hypothetical protein
VASSQDQPEITSSLGNSVGGKERKKRNVAHVDDVDVVFDGVGHDNAQNKPRKTVEKRVLVNISIVLDGGFNAKNQDIYQLQVAVPLPKDKKTNDFYSYNVESDEEVLSQSTTDAQEASFTETSFADTSSQSTEKTSSFTEFDDGTEGLKLI